MKSLLSVFFTLTIASFAIANEIEVYQRDTDLVVLSYLLAIPSEMQLEQISYLIFRLSVRNDGLIYRPSRVALYFTKFFDEDGLTPDLVELIRSVVKKHAAPRKTLLYGARYDRFQATRDFYFMADGSARVAIAGPIGIALDVLRLPDMPIMFVPRPPKPKWTPKNHRSAFNEMERAIARELMCIQHFAQRSKFECVLGMLPRVLMINHIIPDVMKVNEHVYWPKNNKGKAQPILMSK